ncbi:MAG: S9 family peptidase [Bacteroidota bacterium]
MNRIKQYLQFSFCLFIFTIIAVSFSPSQEKKHLTWEQIFKNGEPKLTKPLPNIQGWSDDSHYLEQKKKEGEKASKVYSIDVNTGEEKLFRDMDQYKSLVDTSIDINSPASSNESYTKLIYVKDKDLYYFDTETKEFKRLTQTPSEEKNPTLSPDSRYVAFTRDNDLYSIEIATGKENRYTNDGADVIYNGWAAWVYYEEIFGRPSHYRAFWWSPDSKNLAFYHFDETKVPMFPIYNSEGQHGFLEKTHYPEVGDPNPEVKIGVVTISNGNITWADFNAKNDQYFGTPFWTPDGSRLLVQWMNRDQDTLKLYGVDPATGSKKDVYIEHQTSWVEWFESLEFLKDGKGFIYLSDRSGWNQIYYHSLDGNEDRQITKGKWAVTGVTLVDEPNDKIYFTARKEVSTRTDFYSASLNGGDIHRLSFGEFSHSIKISPKGSYFITSYSNITTPSQMALCDNTGKQIKELGKSKTKDFDDYEIAKTELFTVKTPDGYELPVSWILPDNFNPKKKYPVLISIYGGPNAGTVYDTWGGIRSQWFAKEGMIQIAIDHRGSGHFGKEGVAEMYRHLGKWEMNDYIEVVKWLRTKAFIDSTKICITGGSYGGYTTCMAMTYGAGYFTHGVADFSVTDWSLYDSHYTERYMNTPDKNPDGYKESSPITYADKYKGMMLIVHGTMDDNVHMQNSIQLINKFEDLGKHFELMIYPGERHGWGGPKATHLRNETYRFYYKYLLEIEFPEKLFSK